MSDPDEMKEARVSYSAPTAVRAPEFISAAQARQLTDHAVFRDLVGCALSSGEPEWSATPQPHWRVPYRSLNGVLLATIDVDARTQIVSLTDEQRMALLEKIGQLAAAI
jgi:hypothetical protein